MHPANTLIYTLSTYRVQLYMQSGLMDPEVYLVFRQFLYNRKTVVTDINSFISENTLTRAFTVDDYYYYFTTLFGFQLAFLVAFVLWHLYRIISHIVKFIAPKIGFT